MRHFDLVDILFWDAPQKYIYIYIYKNVKKRQDLMLIRTFKYSLTCEAPYSLDEKLVRLASEVLVTLEEMYLINNWGNCTFYGRVPRSYCQNCQQTKFRCEKLNRALVYLLFCCSSYRSGYALGTKTNKMKNKWARPTTVTDINRQVYSSTWRNPTRDRLWLRRKKH